MRLVADESVDGPIVERLRAEGHEVLYVAELDPGITDEVVLEQARAAGCLLVTSDKDFGELIFRLKQLPGGVVHWGSRSSRRADTPRISWSIYFQSSDVPPYPDARELRGPLTFEQRLAFIGAAIAPYDRLYPLPAPLRAFVSWTLGELNELPLHARRRK